MKCCIDKKQHNYWVIGKNGELVFRAETRSDLQGVEGIGGAVGKVQVNNSMQSKCKQKASLVCDIKFKKH